MNIRQLIVGIFSIIIVFAGVNHLINFFIPHQTESEIKEIKEFCLKNNLPWLSDNRCYYNGFTYSNLNTLKDLILIDNYKKNGK